MMTAVQLRREGFRALCDRLGVAGALRFLDQYEPGSGNYTRERARILGKKKVRDVTREIRLRFRKR